MAEPHSPRPTLRQVLVGLFVVWQLLYLLTANVLAFLPHGDPPEDEITDSPVPPTPPDCDGPLQTIINRTACVTDAWGQSSGQTQVWSLFAPNVPKQATFPMLELRWDAPEAVGGSAAGVVPPPVQLTSPLEPDDLHSYLRLPGSADRYFHFEVRLGLVYLDWDERSADDLAQVWSEIIARRVGRQWKSLRAYMSWRTRHFAEENPELPPPTQVVFHLRIYRADGKDQTAPSWQGPFAPRLARWRPDLDDSADFLPVEAWNPVLNNFVRLPRKGPKT